MSKEYRIYDDRTNETFFKGSWFECAAMLSQVGEDDDMFPHIWIEELEGEKIE